MEDKLKQSEQAREQLAKELVRTRISLECADNTIKKQQENIKELEVENTRLKSYLREIKAISEKFLKNVSENCINITPMFLVHKEIIQKITKAEEDNIG